MAEIPPILSFPTPHDFEEWLEKNVTVTQGIWLRMYKKATNIPSVTYAQALEVALCYGWIDGQSKKYDESSWLQKFTPRRKGSIWSQRNTEHVERLIREGRMKESGLKEIAAAKADGRWAAAYASQSTFTVPADFMSELEKDAEAYAFFNTLSKTNRYAIAFRLATAKKPETRAKRFATFLEMMKAKKKFY